MGETIHRVNGIDGMGHNLPEQLWPRIHDLIEATALAATASSGA